MWAAATRVRVPASSSYYSVELEEHSRMESRVHRDVIHSAVDFIYSDENIGRPA